MGAGDAWLVVAVLNDRVMQVARAGVGVDQVVQGAADGRIRIVNRVVAFAAYRFEQVE